MKLQSVTSALTVLFAATLLAGPARPTTDQRAGDTVTDVDGHVYKTVKIGAQVWMAENLRVTRYRDGSAIPNVADQKAWAALKTGAYCDYANDASNGAVYGHMCNHHAVLDQRHLAPAGWHVATEADWDTLEKFLGGSTTASAKLKEAGNAHWQGDTQKQVDNSSGFSALPGGFRWANPTRGFEMIRMAGTWWLATDDAAAPSTALAFHIDESGTGKMSRMAKENGGYVRCVKD